MNDSNPSDTNTLRNLLKRAIHRLYRSPALVLVTVALSVFFSEAVVRVSLSSFNLLSHPVHHIIDSLILILVLTPVLVILVFRPIKQHLTQRKIAEEELATERNTLRNIFDALPSIVCIISNSHEIVYANTSLINEFGPVEGRTCHDYFHGLANACTTCEIDKVLAGKSIIKEWTSGKTGKIFETSEIPLRNADGTFSMLVMAHDITARKSTEADIQSSHLQLRALTSHIQQAREEERTKIAREIHDELGQVLATVQMGVSLLVEEYRDHHHLTAKVSALETMLEGAIKSVQRISTELRPIMLDMLGLAEAIEWQSKEFQKNTGIACETFIALQDERFGRDVSTAVFRIFQETLTNIIRHSGADHVKVSLDQRGDRIILAIKDNGKGITREQLSDSQSLGIMGMRERALALGGRMKIIGAPQQGAAVIVSLPTHQPEEG